MSGLQMEIIKKYAEANRQPDTMELDYGEFTVTAKTGLTIEEKLSFVETVVKNACVDGITPSSLLIDVAFAITFMQTVCVDLPLPTKESDGESIVDSQAAYDMAAGLDILHKYGCKSGSELINELKRHISARIEFENRKILTYIGKGTAGEETMEYINALLTKGTELLTVVTEQAEKNGEKLFGSLTEKNIGKWVSDLQKKIVKAVSQPEKKPNNEAATCRLQKLLFTLINFNQPSMAFSVSLQMQPPKP